MKYFDFFGGLLYFFPACQPPFRLLHHSLALPCAGFLFFCHTPAFLPIDLPHRVTFAVNEFTGHLMTSLSEDIPSSRFRPRTHIKVVWMKRIFLGAKKVERQLLFNFQGVQASPHNFFEDFNQQAMTNDCDLCLGRFLHWSVIQSCTWGSSLM